MPGYKFEIADGIGDRNVNIGNSLPQDDYDLKSKVQVTISGGLILIPIIAKRIGSDNQNIGNRGYDYTRTGTGAGTGKGTGTGALFNPTTQYYFRNNGYVVSKYGSWLSGKAPNQGADQRWIITLGSDGNYTIKLAATPSEYLAVDNNYNPPYPKIGSYPFNWSITGFNGTYT
ncbi:hypothetical protein AX14_006854, partial [Amanita brunnescens Koide BX004]